jgi:hypothetical protein
MSRSASAPLSRPASASSKPRMPASRRRKKLAQGAPLYRRRSWLRTLALTLGVLVMLAHIFTLKPIAVWLDWLHIDWPDIAKHFTMLSLFAVSYRLSWSCVSRHEKSHAVAKRPGLATVVVCSSWGALCECIQHWIPARDFSVFELAVNILTPVLIAGLFALGENLATAWRQDRS